MTRTQQLVALAGLMVLVFVGAAFATDALITDSPVDSPETSFVFDEPGSPPTTIGAATDVGVAGPVRLVSPYWVDETSGTSDPAPPPPIDSDAGVDSDGIQVMRPAAGEPTDHPPDEGRTVDAGFIADPDAEIIPEGQQNQPGVPAPLAVPPLPALQRFVDPCAVFVGGACPVGLPARVVLVLEQPQLSISASALRGDEGTMDNGAAGCQADFVESEFFLYVPITIPSSIEFTYRQSLPGGPATTVSIPALGPGDPEYDRWIENQSNGEFDDVRLWTWFRTCVALDLEPNAFYEVFDITARSFDGQVAVFERPVSISTVPPGETAGKPQPTFVYSNSTRLSVHVWKKSFDDGYRAFVWPIDLSDPEAASCSEVESELFQGRILVVNHPDFRVAAQEHRAQAATPHQIYDDEYAFTQQFDMALREGRRYTLCMWEVRIGSASFDEWEILDRQQYDVMTPNAHPIVMTLVRTGVREDSNPHRVSVYAENHDYCDSRGPVLGATVERAQSGTQLVREVFCETWGLPPEGVAFTRISVDNVVTDILAIPLDPFTNCGNGTSDPGCALRVSEYVAHTVDVPGSCDSNCTWVDLRFRIDYLPSNGEGSDSLRVGPAGTFDGLERVPVAGPDVDLWSMTLEPVPDRVNALRATFELSSLSDYTITAIAPVNLQDGDESCNSEVSGRGEGHVDIILQGLCANTMYQFGSIVLSDSQGNTTQRDLGGYVRQVWTNGYASFLWADVVLASVNDEAEATVHCAETDSQGGFSRGADEDCWNHLEIGMASPISLGGERAWPKSIPACVSSLGNPTTVAVPWSAGIPRISEAVVHGDLVQVDLTFYIEVSPECGSGGNSPGYFTIFELHTELNHEFGDRDITFTFDEDGITWNVIVGWEKVGIANRQT